MLWGRPMSRIIARTHTASFRRLRIRKIKIAGFAGLALLALAAGFMASQPPSESYLVAKADLAVGSVLDETNTETLNVALGDLGSKYLVAESASGKSFVVTSALTAGELIAIDQVGSSGAASLRPVVALTLAQNPAAGIKVGSVVDLWSASANVSSPAVLIAKAATIMRLNSSNDTFGASKTILELAVSPAEVASVISAMGSDSKIFAVRSIN